MVGRPPAPFKRATIDTWNFKNFPKVIGIVADKQYPRKDYIFHVIKNAKSGSLIVLPQGGGYEEHIRDLALLRGDIGVKMLVPQNDELLYLGQTKVNSLNDYMFLSYIKYLKGRILFFPTKYQHSGDIISRKTSTQYYARRVQDMIIAAHTLDIRYDVTFARTKEEEKLVYSTDDEGESDTADVSGSGA